MHAIKTLKLRHLPLCPSTLASLSRLESSSATPDDFLQLCAGDADWSVRQTGLLCLAEEAFGKLDFETACACVSANVEHDEPRTRLAAVEVLGKLTKIDGKKTWSRFADMLRLVAEKNSVLDLEQRGEEAERMGMEDTKQNSSREEEESIVDTRLPIELEIGKTKMFSVVRFSDFRGRVRANSSGASARVRLDSGAIVLMVHETMGWKALETSLRGLDKLLAGYGPDFVLDGRLTPELVDLCENVLDHENRFVREVGYQICESLVGLCAEKNAIPGDFENRARLAEIRMELYDRIAAGMCDTFSQVRLRACYAARALMLTKPGAEAANQDEDEACKSMLGPAICLNGHYMAEGIRSYCKETWRMVFQEAGAQYAAERASTYAEFYVSQMTSKDDFARDAACIAAGELAMRAADAKLIEPFVDMMMEGLVHRLGDASWNVRSSALLSLSTMAKRYERVDISKTKLVPLFLKACADPVWSVREDAAAALGILAQSFRHDVLSTITNEAKSTMNFFCKDREEHHHHHDHEEESSHENQPMFSCCSVEMSNPGAGLPQPKWVFCDGAIRIVREIAAIAPELAEAELMNAFVDVVEVLRRFGAVGSLDEIIWTTIPIIAKSLGKRPFKRFLDPIIPAIIQSLSIRKRAKSAHAAAVTCKFLREWIGEGVFKSRVENVDSSYWAVVESSSPDVFEPARVSFRG